MRHLRVRAHLVALPLLFTAAACGGDDGGGGTMAGGAGERAAATEGATVTVATFDFQPDPLTVPPGTTVTFVNEDAIDHTVTAGTRDDPRPDAFDGQLPDEGATFELTLDEPGTYDYFCEIHPGPGMTGSIVVE